MEAATGAVDVVTGIIMAGIGMLTHGGFMPYRIGTVVVSTGTAGAVVIGAEAAITVDACAIRVAGPATDTAMTGVEQCLTCTPLRKYSLAAQSAIGR